MKPSVQHSSSKNNTILTKKITMLMTTITTIYKYKDVPLLKGLEKHIMTQLKVQYILKTPQTYISIDVPSCEGYNELHVQNFCK